MAKTVHIAFYKAVVQLLDFEKMMVLIGYFFK